MRQRYVLYPGLVTDEGPHPQFIGASALARLYGVDMRDCVVFDPSLANEDSYGDCIHLYPRHYLKT